MTAFPSLPTDGQVYSIGLRSWTYSTAKSAWALNRGNVTGPTGPTGIAGPAGVLLTSLTVDTFVGDGTTTTFPLSLTPISAYNMVVNVDGLVQTAVTNYTITGDDIVFSVAPINNASIDIIHFLTGSAIPGPTGPTGIPGANSVVTGPTGPSGGPTGPTGPVGQPRYPTSRTVVNASPYSASASAEYLGVVYSGNVTINLSPGIDNQGIIIKDERGTAAINPIMIVADGLETIDNINHTNVAVNYGAVTIWYNSTGWQVISRA